MSFHFLIIHRCINVGVLRYDYYDVPITREIGQEIRSWLLFLVLCNLEIIFEKPSLSTVVFSSYKPSDQRLEVKFWGIADSNYLTDKIKNIYNNRRFEQFSIFFLNITGFFCGQLGSMRTNAQYGHSYSIFFHLYFYSLLWVISWLDVNEMALETISNNDEDDNYLSLYLVHISLMKVYRMLLHEFNICWCVRFSLFLRLTCYVF